jgi:hypothetical protein
MLLIKELQNLDVEAIPCVWNDFDPRQSADDNRGLVIRSVWDYTKQTDKFLHWLIAVKASGIPVMNPIDLMLWNIDKRYIAELRRLGIPFPDTLFPDEDEEIETTAHNLPGTEIVIKPRVGESGEGVIRVPRNQIGATVRAMESPRQVSSLMFQEFMPEIYDGELSFIFIGGTFSHCIRKRPRLGEFRVNRQYDPQPACLVSPGEKLISAAECALQHLPAQPMYARVDGIERGSMLICLEIELIDPALYFDLYPVAASMMAREIVDEVREFVTA